MDKKFLFWGLTPVGKIIKDVEMEMEVEVEEMVMEEKRNRLRKKECIIADLPSAAPNRRKIREGSTDLQRNFSKGT